MKLAVQTVIWGSELPNLEHALDLIASFGFLGVEFAQPTYRLPPFEKLSELLKERNLKLLGLSGGSIYDRIQYCLNAAVKPEYLYVDDYDARNANLAMKHGHVLALHPHVYKPVHRVEQAWSLLKNDTNLRFLPDVAHLAIAGDDPLKAIINGLDKTVAIHLKDWSSVFGRSPHRYARGFTPLGFGDLPLNRILDYLRSIKYDKWIVLEQGAPAETPENRLREAVEWFLAKGVLPRRQRMVSTLERTSQEPQISSEEGAFLKAMLGGVTQNIPGCYSTIASSLLKFTGAQLVMVCTCSPVADVMSLLAFNPLSVALERHVLKFSESVCSISVERQGVTTFDLSKDAPADGYGRPDLRFQCPEILRQFNVRLMTSVPVLNPNNPHQVRLLINLFWDEKTRDAKTLMRLGEYVAIAADSALDEVCATAAACTNSKAGKCKAAKEFLTELLGIVTRTLHCEAVSIFLVNDAGDRLELGATTGIDWEQDAEEFYALNEGILGRVWGEKEARICSDPAQDQNYSGKSKERLQSPPRSSLYAPFLDASDNVVGVIRCRNKLVSEGGAWDVFTDDDLAIVDAIFQAGVAHLQILVSRARRAQALKRLTHELAKPVVAIRGAAQMMRLELRTKPNAHTFSEDYPADISSWSDLMSRLLGNADLFRLADAPIALTVNRVFLLKEVVAPACRQAKQVLDDRGFSAESIVYSGFDEIPPLWVDKNRMQQVFFNLLSNSVKYAYKDADAFRVEIVGRRGARGYSVHFLDYGTGIEERFREVVFKEGFRTPSAERANVSGDGLGLWVARRIARAHGGDITLSNCRHPTEFTLSFPLSAARPPIQLPQP